LKSPAFERVRENFTEFGRCSKAGKFLRRRLGNLFTVCDSFCYQRMTQLMSNIKNFDRLSPRGKRMVSIGLGTPEGKELFYNFAYNAACPLQKIVVRKPVIKANGEIHIQSKDLVFPEGASHAVISGARLQMNLEQEKSLSVVYTTQMLSIEDTFAVIKMRAKQKEEQEGNVFYFLQVRFYKMYAGKLAPFENGKQDSLGCIALDPLLPEEIKTCILKGEILSFEIKCDHDQKAYLKTKEICPVLMEAPG
jgi:hypothetical protein